MTNVSFPHRQRHNQRRSRSRLCSSERRTTVSLPKTCPVMSVATPATPSGQALLRAMLDFSTPDNCPMR